MPYALGKFGPTLVHIASATRITGQDAVANVSSLMGTILVVIAVLAGDLYLVGRLHVLTLLEVIL